MNICSPLFGKLC